MSGEEVDILQEIREELQTLREEVEALRSNGHRDRLLTRDEAAERLRISTSTLDDMRDLGEIQATKIRGRVLYHPETIETYVRRQTRKT